MPRRKLCCFGQLANRVQPHKTDSLNTLPTISSSMPAVTTSAYSNLHPPCSNRQNQTGVTGCVMWDSGVVLGKFLEHAVDSNVLNLQGKKCVELGSGCGLVGCIAALLGARVILTDLSDRLRLLEKNVEENVKKVGGRGTAQVRELTWGEDLDSDLLDPLPDYVLGSDVVYNEDVVHDLITTIQSLCGSHTIIFISGELRNDVVLEYFLECALKSFIVGYIEQRIWHPEYRSRRVAIFMMTKKL